MRLPDSVHVELFLRRGDELFKLESTCYRLLVAGCWLLKLPIFLFEPIVYWLLCNAPRRAVGSKIYVRARDHFFSEAIMALRDVTEQHDDDGSDNLCQYCVHMQHFHQ